MQPLLKKILDPPLTWVRVCWFPADTAYMLGLAFKQANERVLSDLSAVFEFERRGRMKEKRFKMVGEFQPRLVLSWRY